MAGGWHFLGASSMLARNGQQVRVRLLGRFSAGSCWVQADVEADEGGPLFTVVTSVDLPRLAYDRHKLSEQTFIEEGKMRADARAKRLLATGGWQPGAQYEV